MVPKEGAGSYHLGASNPLEDAAYVVGGYTYNSEVCPVPTDVDVAGHRCYCSDDWEITQEDLSVRATCQRLGAG